MLKAFFKHDEKLDFAYQPTADGQNLRPDTSSQGALTVEGELNKLTSNIAIGRNWAGVHYFTDYIEGIRLGEKIAVSILEEQAYTFVEDFSMTIPTFDRETLRITKKGSRVRVRLR